MEFAAHQEKTPQFTVFQGSEPFLSYLMAPGRWAYSDSSALRGAFCWSGIMFKEGKQSKRGEVLVRTQTSQPVKVPSESLEWARDRVQPPRYFFHLIY